MTNQIPEKTNNNINESFNKAVRTVRRLSGYRIISVMIWLALVTGMMPGTTVTLMPACSRRNI